MVGMLVKKVPSFNPRTPCGVRLAYQAVINAINLVSIHALLAECDRVFVIGTRWHPVSIHALLAECDQGSPARAKRPMGFNPRTPCGVRPALANLDMIDMWFQSTHSLRSATNAGETLTWAIYVSIHALLAECDERNQNNEESDYCFNPRTPCGVRRVR